ncbi:cytochrome-c oxidase, cbb3-type subunit III [Shinella sp. JR1-6]|jgi:cytochrome c oxidase cbb3-type subunit 3|uniref:cytochrome-c oxidase, cbb3-type subunit III n=1 Tax=Shinella sp. JR1-6 TaxID=2527671 RepID=UPI00102D41B8|nr:cytochrome-c oxidase, cbb3-type subunit III [Shinella sp. JR1-6]TAA52514.1 cytochrome-c oxidase, cbb3-type subunit III [Shinella sp. JR1-6]
MATERHDPTTGRVTTGHEWNGIEELDTPIPRVVLFFLTVTTLFAIVYWILMPAWPLGVSYTKGLLGIDQRTVVTQQVEDAAAARAAWTGRIAEASLAEIAADDTLMQHVRETGRTLFIDNCAACHGTRGTGGPGFPNLAAKAWLWGGEPETIAETIRIGINSTNEETRVSQMMAFGRDGILDDKQVRAVAAYVRSLSALPMSEADAAAAEAGKEVFTANCVACHGEDGRGSTEAGAPDLTDATWIYGSSAQTVYSSVYSGRQGHMPHWEGRLSPVDIKLLALYVGTLTEGAR